jgi:uncharacterized membrane protein AbrB (regulator of aidB expression)
MAYTSLEQEYVARKMPVETFVHTQGFSLAVITSAACGLAAAFQQTGIAWIAGSLMLLVLVLTVCSNVELARELQKFD